MTTMPLRDHAAYRRETLRWCGQRAARARTLDVFDPYSGLRVGTVPLATVDDVRRAFDYAVAVSYKNIRAPQPKAKRG